MMRNNDKIENLKNLGKYWTAAKIGTAQQNEFNFQNSFSYFPTCQLERILPSK